MNGTGARTSDLLLVRQPCRRGPVTESAAGPDPESRRTSGRAEDPVDSVSRVAVTIDLASQPDEARDAAFGEELGNAPSRPGAVGAPRRPSEVSRGLRRRRSWRLLLRNRHLVAAADAGRLERASLPGRFALAVKRSHPDRRRRSSTTAGTPSRAPHRCQLAATVLWVRSRYGTSVPGYLAREVGGRLGFRRGRDEARSRIHPPGRGIRRGTPARSWRGHLGRRKRDDALGAALCPDPRGRIRSSLLGRAPDRARRTDR